MQLRKIPSHICPDCKWSKREGTSDFFICQLGRKFGDYVWESLPVHIIDMINKFPEGCQEWEEKDHA